VGNPQALLRVIFVVGFRTRVFSSRSLSHHILSTLFVGAELGAWVIAESTFHEKAGRSEP